MNESLYEHDYMRDNEDFNNNEVSQTCMSLPANDIIVAVEQPTSKATNSQSVFHPISQYSTIESSNELSKLRPKPCLVSSPMMSSSSSSSSLSNMCSQYNATSSTYDCIKKKKHKIQNEDTYIEAIESIAQSLKTPLTTSVNNITDIIDPVDACMSFLGSLIKNLQLPESRLDIMNTLIQIVIKASAIDVERSKKKKYR